MLFANRRPAEWKNQDDHQETGPFGLHHTASGAVEIAGRWAVIHQRQNRKRGYV
jgi:hypothetical protein